jgi:hypothetical protein
VIENLSPVGGSTTGRNSIFATDVQSPSRVRGSVQPRVTRQFQPASNSILSTRSVRLHAIHDVRTLAHSGGKKESLATRLYTWDPDHGGAETLFPGAWITRFLGGCIEWLRRS